MKAIWSGNISFALVSIPVRIYGATRKKDVRFHMLHMKCSTPLAYERYCATCNKEVPWEEVTHGYEYEKGRLVVVSDEEIESLPVKTTKSIDVLRFIGGGEVDPIYYDKAYYIEPAEGAERAYVLFRETMKASGKAALAKIALREKEHVAVLRTLDSALTLHTLYYADEIIKPSALNIPEKISLDPKEKALAEQLLKHFIGKFDIAAYRDEMREALMELIRAKISGKEIKVPPKKEAAKVVSLMDALKKSLEKKTPEKKRKTA
jgi:DNA end-binding protein Ku